MKHFGLIHTGVDTAPILDELAAHPQLWDEHADRRLAPGGAFAAQTDIWVRTRARCDTAAPDAFRTEYRPVFYPAWSLLPSLHAHVWALMAAHRGTELGNILITRLPPGEAIGTHTDAGWSVDWYDRKFYLVLHSNARCVNACGGEEVAMRTGEVWRFENRVPHSVENHGATERLSLIVTLRAET